MSPLGLPTVGLVLMVAAGLAGAQGGAQGGAARHRDGVVLADGTLAAVVEYLVHVARHVAKTPTQVVALLCEQSRGRALGRALTARGLQVAVMDRGDAWSTWTSALPSHRQAETAVTVVLDAACPGAPQILATADRMDQFRVRSRWVLFNAGLTSSEEANAVTAVSLQGEGVEALRAEDNVPRSAGLDACYSRLDGILAGLGVLLDSDVTAVCADKETVVAVYAYRPTRAMGLRLQLAARWPNPAHTASLSSAGMQADRRSLAGRRLNLEESVVNAGFAVEAADRFEDLVNHGGTSRDILAAFAFNMIHYMIGMVNATVNVTMTPTYGQVKGNAVPTQGLTGLVVKEEVEVASAFVMLDERLKYFDYTNFFVPLTGVMVFRAPPLSYEYNVFTLPFPASVWGAAVAMVLLCTAILSLVLHSEGGIDRGDHGDQGVHEDHALRTNGDAFLMSVAAVCQQGYSVEMPSIPGRIVVLMLLMLLLVLYTCYTASIVVLMQSTSSKITHFKDLLSTDMKLGLVNIPYVVFYASSETEPVRRKLWTDKILDKGRQKHLYGAEEGVRKVQREYFAFYGIENSIYGSISSTWTEEQKCNLVIMGRDFLRVKNPQVVFGKRSHNSKAMTIMLRRMAERGIWRRANTIYSRPKPKCSNKASAFSSVSLTDVRGAFFMLLSLMAGSVALLLVELAWHRRQAQQAQQARLVQQQGPRRRRARASARAPARVQTFVDHYD